MCAPALARRGDVAPSRRSGGGAPVPLPPVRLHSAAGPHLPAAPRPLPTVGPCGLRAERLRATPALFFRLHAVLHGTVASVIRSLDAWWVWARVTVTSPTKRLLHMEHSGVRSVIAGDGVVGKCSTHTPATVLIPAITLRTFPAMHHAPWPFFFVGLVTSTLYAHTHHTSNSGTWCRMRRYHLTPVARCFPFDGLGLLN